MNSQVTPSRLRGLLAIAVVCVVTLVGCATQKAVNADIGRVDQRLAQLDQRLGQLEQALKSQGDRLAKLETGMTEVSAAATEAGKRAETAAAAAREAAAQADRATQASAEARERAARADETAGSALARADAAGSRAGRAGGGAAATTGAVLDTANVRFAFDHWDLDDRAQSALTDLLKRLEGKGAVVLTLEGHTDSVGADGYNFELSRKRAEAVRRFVVDRGIQLSRIEFIGFGETHPVADNATPGGRAENRRVLIKLVAPE